MSDDFEIVREGILQDSSDWPIMPPLEALERIEARLHDAEEVVELGIKWFGKGYNSDAWPAFHEALKNAYQQTRQASSK